RRLRELLDAHGVRPSKSLGQNFVVDPNTIRKVVSVAEVGPDDHVLEIGAGAGSLTLGLAAAAGRVTAVEFDRALHPVLADALRGVSNVEVVHADATKLDWPDVRADALVANLPYNIATPLVLDALAGAPALRTLTVMTQREAGERLAAAPGSKTYGHVSVVVAFYARAAVAASISRRVFYPEPNVDSVLVRLVRRTPPLDDAGARNLFRLTRAAFSQRRKTLRSSLAGVAPHAGRLPDALRAAGIAPAARPEELGIEEWLALESQLFA
ncbi:MAG TPA: 16S rRNA (adenine(1518)-N(6)/adenine(1519)-N(6))-dimethyltransferase RsmA, partial [Actinomycetota bacterium]|nr:16S rRNA (adenine(1518)-N(6)/adenine(1519)-N(6))-dimethyltransferase RsmA [Actinomycetota bacterium]